MLSLVHGHRNSCHRNCTALPSHSSSWSRRRASHQRVQEDEGRGLDRILVHAEAQRRRGVEGRVPPVTVIPKIRRILLEAIALLRDSDNKY